MQLLVVAILPCVAVPEKAQRKWIWSPNKLRTVVGFFMLGSAPGADTAGSGLNLYCGFKENFMSHGIKHHHIQREYACDPVTLLARSQCANLNS